MQNDFKYPPFLQKGDKVTVVSPSSIIEPEVLEGGIKCLKAWGLKVTKGKFVSGKYGNFSGTVKQRLGDLQRALDDPDCKAIFCSRGGYGANNLLDQLNFTEFHKHPKWLIGFSDITALHCLWQHEGFTSLHAPMLKHLIEQGKDDFCNRTIHDILFGDALNKRLTYTVEGHTLNRTGKANGILHGGNLAVWHGLRSTPYDINPEGTILFVEDVGEKPHAIERMFYNLKLSGFLDRLSGLIVCLFTEFEEHKQLGKELYPALADLLKPYTYPICFGFPVGHVPMNLPMIEGAKVELRVNKNEVKLKFI
ncbi:MAG: LD-carboxypeptidase [Bacteroidaceae bacterium]|jgi:muramoyltetrapeptide carboxypeptidase|nr:LD-carboxypeptidase [Bacteroidaceae bacterium]